MRILKGVSVVVALTLALLAGQTTNAHATSMLTQNAVDLVSLSERIMVGNVIALDDGFNAQGLPYTEVTLRVDDSLRGDNGSTYTFRQFGLMAPRQLADGTTALGVSPDGWPRFRQDEQVMVFLYKPASETGLQTTVGLLQGKFTIVGESIVNGIGNKNLFHDVRIDESMLSAEQARLVREPATMQTGAFVEFVRRAVTERWVEEGRMINEQH